MTSKSKFAGLAQARMEELETETGESPLETLANPAKQKTAKKTVKQAYKPTSQKAGKTASKTASKATSKNEGSVPIAARTLAENRIWWLYQARLQNTTLQDAIVEALTKRFGLPKKPKTK